MEELELPWSVIDTYFRDNPRALVQHHLNSFNDFFDGGIQSIMKERNPIRVIKQQNPVTKEFRLRCELYLGGKNGDKVYFGKPMIYDDDRTHFMYPNEARLRNMTYGVTIHYDIEVDYHVVEDDGSTTEMTKTIEKVLLGRFPIMLMSKLCILDGLEPRVRFNMGECRNDHGGYFIIDGKEKCIISQEKFADNMLYVRDKGNELYSHSAEIRSVSEDASKPVRTVGVRIVRPTAKLTNKQIVVSVPNVRKPVPLFILMRALGIESDRDIIRYCLLDMEKYSHLVDLFIPSIHDAGTLFTQEACIQYIKTLTKGHTVSTVMDVLMNYFLPHVGEMNFQEKAYFVGYMVRELLMVFAGDKKATDRDNFKFKRIEVNGSLLYDLFKEYYSIQQRQMFQLIDKEYFFHQDTYSRDIDGWVRLVEGNYKEYVKERVVELGFRNAFKGSWGSASHTKRDGVVQDLNRLSFNSFISHLRKLNLPLDASAKVVGPRMLHSSQWGIIDPVDTPDGANIGLHKHMAIGAHISSGCSSKDIIRWLPKHISFKRLLESDPEYLAATTKIMVNGNWIGNTPEPEDALTLMREYKRLGLLPPQYSIHWHIETDTLYIYTDAGRLYRPIYYVDEQTGKPSYAREGVLEKMLNGSASWTEMTTGFGKKVDDKFNPNGCRVYDSPSDLYGVDDITKLASVRAPIEFIDSAEEETALIAMDLKQLRGQAASSGKGNGRMAEASGYTHLEIHPSLMLGVMGNQIVFPENNQLPRDLFSCGQSKQGVSLYHSNFQNRIDKSAIVLNSGQIPVVKSRYMDYLCREQHPYGENLVVAIMCYGGYNTEDAILFNGGSVARGMLRVTYYNMYEAYEESSKIGTSEVDSRFANVQDHQVIGTKPGYDYGYLDEHGLIKENTQVDDKMIVIGKITTNLSDPTVSLDSSVAPKKGQNGFVDKTFITEGQEGKRLAKVRIRAQRPPAIGDKFCSRCGQKGTCGLIIEEKDMPFTADGVRPDIIINPHALPSRMTIGQLVETLMGKACLFQGAFGDCTAFANRGPKQKVFGEILQSVGFHNSGTELLYNGMTGEQMETNIFIGPTYYMRLKQMVKDKINYRARGPRTVLTRQTVHGRAKDGGLRVGEMERDGLIAHGLSGFLEESMMVRGDEYYMAICNNTGAIAIYNQSRNVFLSPFADGPIQFKNGLDNTLNLENVSRFGKTFSIVRVPYALKLLIQELQTMNIQMRIITEDNVDKLTAMSSNKELRFKLGLDDEAEPKKFGIVAKELLTQGLRTRTQQQQQQQQPADTYEYDRYQDAAAADEARYQYQAPYYGEEQEQQQGQYYPQYDDEYERDEMDYVPRGQPDSVPKIRVEGGPVFIKADELPGTIANVQGQPAEAAKEDLGGFLGGGVGGGDEGSVVGTETDIQAQTQAQPQGQSQGQTVLNQTIVLSGLGQQSQQQLTPDEPLTEEMEDEKTNSIMATITDAKEASDASLTVDTEPAGAPAQPLSLLHNIVDDIKGEDGDGDGNASSSGAKTISFV